MSCGLKLPPPIEEQLYRRLLGSWYRPPVVEEKPPEEDLAEIIPIASTSTEMPFFQWYKDALGPTANGSEEVASLGHRAGELSAAVAQLSELSAAAEKARFEESEANTYSQCAKALCKDRMEKMKHPTSPKKKAAGREPADGQNTGSGGEGKEAEGEGDGGEEVGAGGSPSGSDSDSDSDSGDLLANWDSAADDLRTVVPYMRQSLAKLPPEVVQARLELIKDMEQHSTEGSNRCYSIQLWLERQTRFFSAIEQRNGTQAKTFESLIERLEKGEKHDPFAMPPLTPDSTGSPTASASLDAHSPPGAPPGDGGAPVQPPPPAPSPIAITSPTEESGLLNLNASQQQGQPQPPEEPGREGEEPGEGAGEEGVEGEPPNGTAPPTAPDAQKEPSL